jgi:hypothetical protein
MFQKRIVTEYEKMVDEFGLTVIDAMQSITDQQMRLREIVRPFLRGLHRERPNQAGRWMAGPNGNGGEPAGRKRKTEQVL